MKLFTFIFFGLITVQTVEAKNNARIEKQGASRSVANSAGLKDLSFKVDSVSLSSTPLSNEITLTFIPKGEVIENMGRDSERKFVKDVFYFRIFPGKNVSRDFLFNKFFDALVSAQASGEFIEVSIIPQEADDYLSYFTIKN